MSIRLVARLAIVGMLAVCATGCASWDRMSSRQKSMVVGAGAGGLIGAAVSGGGVLSTVGGAAIGGVLGDQVGKR
ncbi:glycine zipper 2TM domain-containing protein [Pigmentiphaga soli]|uniref:Glycine zipper 2TM domain-containing protein n=1 Tax=Pigmentiphaga soli TaxID=1007095 RepID=A0ABP8GVI4_9BURK